ncbi:hypothetical protein C8Q77DRAFT_776775 [Trametes polyzona]|nr:hypothetical protein C8Q77DRAFT_776775 [Trametes polyzona]
MCSIPASGYSPHLIARSDDTVGIYRYFCSHLVAISACRRPSLSLLPVSPLLWIIASDSWLPSAGPGPGARPCRQHLYSTHIPDQFHRIPRSRQPHPFTRPKIPTARYRSLVPVTTMYALARESRRAPLVWASSFSAHLRACRCLPPLPPSKLPIRPQVPASHTACTQIVVLALAGWSPGSTQHQLQFRPSRLFRGPSRSAPIGSRTKPSRRRPGRPCARFCHSGGRRRYS